MKVILVFILLLAITAFAVKWSQPHEQPSGNNLPTSEIAGCISSASVFYQLPTDVIIGVIRVEGGHVGQAVGPNANGTYDLGIMQVNSIWVPQLAQLWQVDYPTAYAGVRDNGCANVYVGAWILKQKIVEAGDLRGGIAAYHSATRGLGSNYANKVAMAMPQ